MKVLTFSSLYPNAETPSLGVFVENRLRHLVGHGRVEARVVAPVPWFPLSSRRLGRYGSYARVPHRERRHGIAVAHPRYLTVPGVGMYSAPLAMAIGAYGAIARFIDEGFQFDAIDAHYFYPDGVAAALLARWFGKPLVVTARGSDITQLAGYTMPRAAIRWAAGEAAAIVTVCAALKRTLVALGVDGSKVEVLRNGVDLERFGAADRVAARARLGLPVDARVVASVGYLIPRKGHDLAIEAVASTPETILLVAGSGPEEGALRSLAAARGVGARVRFLGQLAHDELPAIYAAADALVLASTAEGWANVLLESMACGTPVVATDVGGSREVVAAPEAGILLERRDAGAIAAALERLFAQPINRAATRRYAEGFSWDDTTRGQERLFESLRASPPGGEPLGAPR